jgi:hypothetical protein
MSPSTKAIAAAGLALAASHSAAHPGDVLWYFEVDAPDTLHRPSVGADGTIYWSTNSLFAITPAGQELWRRPDADVSPVGIGADGTLYIGGKRPAPSSHLPALKAFSPAGQHLWDYTGFGQVVGFLGGPNVGADGNVYAVTYSGFPNPTGFGAFSLTPATGTGEGGDLRWHFDGFANDAGTPTSEIVFGNGNMYKAEYNAPMPAGQLQSGIIALEFDGDLAWRYSVGTQPSGPSRHPCVSPLNGNVHLMRQPRTLQTFTPGGSLAWIYTGAFTPTGFGAPAAGPDGSIYIINGNLHVIALDAAGDERWIAHNVVPRPAHAPEVSPDGGTLVFATEACFGGACPGRVIALDTSDGSVIFDEPLPAVPGGVPTARTQPRFSPDGSVVYIGADAFTGFTKSYLFAVGVARGGGACYANCDASTTAPVLNVADFTCFLQQFAAGESYANCDQSTTVPALNVADFTCFLQRFAAGCP